MIRFVYPNIDDEEFIGCGRYLTTWPNDPILENKYILAKPNANLSEIHTVTSLLAPEPSGIDPEVFEYKDHSHAGMSGNSLGLAYLMALLKRGRKSIWDAVEDDRDIWCTGAIALAGGNPHLKHVFRNQFDVKIEAFLQTSLDQLFIVPHANITQDHKRLCHTRHVRALTLAEFKSLPVEEHFARKTILQLHGHELQPLVEFLFNISKTDDPSQEGNVSRQEGGISSPLPWWEGLGAMSET